MLLGKERKKQELELKEEQKQLEKEQRQQGEEPERERRLEEKELDNSRASKSSKEKCSRESEGSEERSSRESECIKEKSSGENKGNKEESSRVSEIRKEKSSSESNKNKRNKKQETSRKGWLKNITLLTWVLVGTVLCWSWDKQGLKGEAESAPEAKINTFADAPWRKSEASSSTAKTKAGMDEDDSWGAWSSSGKKTRTLQT
jgi:hypothetical protein